MNGKTLKKLFSLAVTLTMVLQAGFITTVQAEDEISQENTLVPVYGTKIATENYEEYELGATPLNHQLRASQWGASSDQTLTVVQDPLNTENKVLKFSATTTMQSLAFWADIPNSATKTSWVEFDYYNPDSVGMYVGLKRVGVGWGEYVWGQSDSNVITMFNPGEQAWTQFTENQKATDKYVHVRMRMRCIDSETKKVEFTTDVFGYNTFSCEKTLSNDWEGLYIELLTTSVENTGIYLDNISAYTTEEYIPTEYANDNGIIAEDTVEDYEVTTSDNTVYKKLENKGSGWINPWYGSRVVTNAISGMTSGNALVFCDSKNNTTSSGMFDVSDEPMYKRYFKKAINLKKPGIYETEVEFGDASADGEMRLYFGDKNLYASLKSENSMYTPGIGLGDAKTTGTTVSTGSKKVKLRVEVKDENGNANVKMKVLGVSGNGNEGKDWSVVCEDVNICETLGTEYLNWIGIRGTNGGLFKNFKVSKNEAEVEKDSIIPVYGNELFADDFENYGVGNSPSGYMYRQSGFTAGTSAQFTVVEDPKDSSNKVLKIPAISSAEVDFAKSMDIPLSKTTPTWIEFDYYNPDVLGVTVGRKEYGTGWVGDIWKQRADGWLTSAYAQNNGEMAWPNDYKTENAPNNNYTHVRMRMLLTDEETPRTQVTLDLMGDQNLTYNRRYVTTNYNAFEAFYVKVGASSKENAGIYIDNLAIYTEKNVVPTEYATNDGVIAEDTVEDYEIVLPYSKLENKGTGWLNEWYGSRTVTNAISGMTSGKAILMTDKIHYTTTEDQSYAPAEDPMYKRYFKKAINLKSPGIYEAEVEFGDASADGEMRLYFGDENLYAELKSENGQYTPKLNVGTKENTGLAVSTGSKKVKLRVLVKDEDGNADVKVKTYSATGSESIDWDTIITNVNLSTTLGTEYLNWIGIRGTDGGLFKNFKVSKTNATMIEISTLKYMSGESEITAFSDINSQNGLTVNATFENPSLKEEKVTPVLALYKNNRMVKCYFGSEATLTSTANPVNVTVTTNGAIEEDFDEFKVFYWNNSMNPLVFSKGLKEIKID